MTTEEVNIEDFSDESSSIGDIESKVQLGYVVDNDSTNLLRRTNFCNKNWESWDGGKIGGKPIWLDPEHIPDPTSLQCKDCCDPMILLLQIYCPLDVPNDAFHRALYIFCCKRASCNRLGSVHCFRNQLPRVNKYYPEKCNDSESYIENFEQHHNCCVVCGIKAPYTCGNCKTTYYCSSHHQKVHWTFHKSICKGISETNNAPDFSFIFPELPICVEDEIFMEKVKHNANIWDDAYMDYKVGQKDEDITLTQDDYNKSLGNDVIDPFYKKFLSRIDKTGPDQILRYSRWEDTSQLFISTEEAKVLDIPCCENCGSPRKLEMQVCIIYLVIAEFNFCFRSCRKFSTI